MSYPNARTPAAKATEGEDDECERIILSFKDLDTSRVVATDNGFVNTCRRAHEDHQDLHIRPDDVWLSILTQFNLYINTNTEILRHHFVTHEGKNPLSIIALGSTYNYDWAKFPLQISRLIEMNVVDPLLRQWIVPKFSTTTPNDRVVASIVMMSPFQSEFRYKCRLGCGLPSVTLEGTKADWEDVLFRAKRLCDFGPEAAEWSMLLIPILIRFIAAFDFPLSFGNIDFWRNTCHSSRAEFVSPCLSGWITAFCFFDSKGKKMRPRQVEHMRQAEQGLVLDGVQYHMVDPMDIPSAWADVPVEVDDNGHRYKARMVAGSVGMQGVGKLETRVYTAKEGPVTVSKGLRPVAGWWICRIEKVKVEASSRIRP